MSILLVFCMLVRAMEKKTLRLESAALLSALGNYVYANLTQISCQELATLAGEGAFASTYIVHC